MKKSRVGELKAFIRAELARQNLAQNELAERAGLDTGTMSRILQDRGTTPTLASLEKLARGLGYDFYSFVLKAAGLQDVRESEMMRVYQHLRPEHQQLLLEIAWRFDEARVSDRVVESETYHEP